MPIRLLAVALLAGAAVAQKAEVRLDRDPPGAGFSIESAVCAAGDQVFVAWIDARAGAFDVYFQRSADRGESWLPNDVRLDTDAPGSQQSLQPQIACYDDGVDGPDVYVVWSDFRNGGSLQADIYMSVSRDGGSTWTKDIRVEQSTPGVSGGSRSPVVACDAQGVYVAWLDDRNQDNDVYFQRSLDAGATWLGTDTKLNSEGANLNVCQSLSLASNAGKVFAAWNDYRDGGGDVRFNRSLNAGASFLANDVRLDTDVAGAAASAHTSIAAAGTSVYVTWHDNRSGAADIHLNYSSDDGATFQSNDLRLDTDAAGANESFLPEVAVDGNLVYVVWEDWRRTPPPSTCPSEVFMNYSTDAGATWQVADIEVSHSPPCGPTPDHTATVPDVVATNGAVYVAWIDTRNGFVDVFCNRSTNPANPASWLPVDFRLDAGTAAGTVNAASHALAAAGDNVYVVWEDDRNGFGTDIFFNIPFGMQPYGPAKVGSGGLAPVLAGSGRAIIGDNVAFDLTNAWGNTTGAILLGVSRASIFVVGGTINLVPVTSFPIPVPGIAAPGGGAVSVPVGLPPDAALVGLGLMFQIVVIDPGATGTLSMSNGVEMRLG